MNPSTSTTTPPLSAEDLTPEIAAELMRQAVTTAGADHVTRLPRYADGRQLKAGAYADYDGCPASLVGEVLHSAGISLPMPTFLAYAARDVLPLLGVPARTTQLLQITQTDEARGVPWGDLLEEFEAYSIGPNRPLVVDNEEEGDQ